MNCPHPAGTREYYDWWEKENNRLISEVLSKPRVTVPINHGHDFFNRDRKCLCGMSQHLYFGHANQELCPLYDNDNRV